MMNLLMRAVRPAPRRRERGVALLLVMIGLVVCMILAAGFLATQGTSIGIARNERDAQKCREIAQTGVDMCYWQVRNKSDWRETMTRGAAWLSSYAVGDGTVTVTADQPSKVGNFSDDPTQPVIFTSTGTYDSRSYTLVATIQPTGGGTVFNAGNFAQGSILLGNTDLLTQSVIDSYNSSVAPYNSASPGSSAAFGSDTTSAGLTIYSPSIYRGSYTGGPNGALANQLNVQGLLAVTPSSVTVAGEVRTSGAAYAPNTSGLPARAAFSGAGTVSLPQTGSFPSLAVNTGMTNFAYNGTYYVSGGCVINGGTTLNVNPGITAVLIVNGTLTCNGKITLGASSALAVYCNNTASLTNALVNAGGTTSHLTLVGLPNCTQVTLSGTTSMAAAVYAPQAAFVMQSGATKFYGAMVVKSLSITSTGQMHFDQALQSLRLDNIIGGSAPAGTADYIVSIKGGPGMH